MIRVEVVRAWPRRHESVMLQLPEDATVAGAVAASGLAVEGCPECAIFGEGVRPDRRLCDGDRVELLRPLTVDPKDARRRRASSKAKSPANGRAQGDAG